MTLLAVSNISVKFGGLTAVNNVSLNVPKGSIVSVIGPNGAGKTSLFNVITGIYPANSGDLHFENRNLKEKLSTFKIFKGLLISILVGIGTAIFLNAQTLWEHSIINNFIYGEAFNWIAAFHSFTSTIINASVSSFVLPTLIASLLCLAALIVTWKRSELTITSVSKRGLARSFQNIRLFKEMSVLENVLVGMHRKHSSSWLSIILRLPSSTKEAENHAAKALNILESVSLKEYKDQLASSLSYGLQRRLEIARALATDPKIIFLDEPAAGLNPSELSDLIAVIRTIREAGITVVLIEHHMRLVMEISDHVVVLEYGNKIAEGTPQEICQNKRVIEAYLGVSEE